ncbi:MAG: hypothetical protein KDE58_32100, partial [Caldilineaceae bacterium]|nr:hypothetical protein [Caldilineaceae bacterium]
ETPQAELAATMGINAGAVAGRVHRGKEMLKRLLVTDFRDDALALGLVAAENVGWQTTRIWCTSCGERRLRGKFIGNPDGQLLLQCDCGANHGVNGPAGLLQGLRGYRPAWTRAKQWQHTFWQAGLHTGDVNCPHCHQTIPIQVTSDEPSIWTHCPGCGWRLHTDLQSLAGNFPQKIHFERNHPRSHLEPTRPIEYEGAPASLVRTQSRTASAQLDMIFHTHTFTLLDAVVQ